jgi:NTP pyrophosphatase (non-canonical NTP hydrolase)
MSSAQEDRADGWQRDVARRNATVAELARENRDLRAELAERGVGKLLREMQAEIVAVCQDRGWYDQPVSFGEAMALLHSEVSEALEAWRLWGLGDGTAGSAITPGGDQGAKPEGVGSEFADVLIRLLDDCARFGIDLDAEYERKLAYNRTRPYRHGGKRQ